MKIGVIFTGGTIGSTIDQSGHIVADKDNRDFLLLNLYRHKFTLQDEFVIRTPYCILSENLSGRELELLVACVNELKEKVDGIIITHGTDTLQYTAAALGYVYSNLAIPIVLVSSNYVLEDSRANGLTNFACAVSFIHAGQGHGVFVSYCNRGDTPKIHCGTRLQNGLYYSDDVLSIENSYYGEFVLDGRNEERFLQKENDETGTEHMEFLTDRILFDMQAADEIMQIHPYVGMRYPKISEDIRVILHGSFHSGTIAVSKEWEEFAKEAQDKKIPFYLVGLSSKCIHYETVQAYERYGVIPLYDRAWIAQYCKLWLILSNQLNLQATMQREIACEKCK